MKKTSGTKTRPTDDPYIESRYGFHRELRKMPDPTPLLSEGGVKFTGPTGVPTNGARSKSFTGRIDAATRGTAKGK